MKKTLLFDFTVDKDTKTIHVQREFDADKELVWRAWTTAELLDKWWAPLPYRNQTKSMDFREGGAWLYKMVSPENEIHWCRFDYDKIEDQKSFTGLDAFCDENGQINTSFSRMHWKNEFSSNADHTLVHVTITMDTLDTLEKIIAMGFKEGFTMGLDQLEAWLDTQKTKG